MRVFAINHSSYGSTGTIMMGIHEELLKQGHESWVSWPRGRNPKDPRELRFNSEWGVRVHAAFGRLDDHTGFHSTKATKRLVSMIEEVRPDVVHLHNIHGYCLDVEVLFPALRAMRVPVVWTLHSCWPFTGHCTHFTYVRCEQWKTHCSRSEKCPQIRTYPTSLLMDRSYENYDKKRFLFTDMPNMTIVTPSNWLAGLVGESFLASYPCKVIHNGIDTSTFRSDIDTTAIINRYNLAGKHVLLGVANPWSQRKGFYDMIALRRLLGSDYAMVLVGLNKEQSRSIPKDIIGLRRTDSKMELAELYAAADLFINPTYEDNYPSVNLEALACGTNVVTYDTGGSPECSDNRQLCIVTEDKTPVALANAITGFFAKESSKVDTMIKDITECSRDYVHLYEYVSERY